MTPPRSFPVFSVVFAAVFSVAYIVAAEANYPLFTYHPAIGEFGLGFQKPKDGPAMLWYGWIATATIVAFVAGVLACWLPESLTRRLWSGWAWVAPLAVMAAFPWFLKEFFLK